MSRTLGKSDPARRSRVSLHLSRASSKLRTIRLDSDMQLPSAAPDIVIGSAQREEGVPDEIAQAAKDFYQQSSKTVSLGVDIRSTRKPSGRSRNCSGPKSPKRVRSSSGSTA